MCQVASGDRGGAFRSGDVLFCLFSLVTWFTYMHHVYILWFHLRLDLWQRCRYRSRAGRAEQRHQHVGAQGCYRGRDPGAGGSWSAGSCNHLLGRRNFVSLLELWYIAVPVIFMGSLALLSEFTSLEQQRRRPRAHEWRSQLLWWQLRWLDKTVREKDSVACGVLHCMARAVLVGEVSVLCVWFDSLEQENPQHRHGFLAKWAARSSKKLGSIVSGSSVESSRG